jgi:hypothetical protein
MDSSSEGRQPIRFEKKNIRAHYPIRRPLRRASVG